MLLNSKIVNKGQKLIPFELLSVDGSTVSEKELFKNFSSEYRKSLKGKISYLKKNYRKFADESISSKIWKK